MKKKIQPVYTGVYELEVENRVSAAVIWDGAEAFREEGDMLPIPTEEGLEFMPWGADNSMPHGIIALIESDETLTTCQQFNTEICYGGGLKFDCTKAKEETAAKVEDFVDDNNVPAYFLGVCLDLKYFGFAVTVLYLNTEGTEIMRIVRKNACYVRFAPADGRGRIPYLLYANWRTFAGGAENVEKVEILDAECPHMDLRRRMESGSRVRKFAVITRIPTPDNTYYPIPPYASLFKGRWYAIKQLIGVAKEAKLRNSAPLKYLIEINDRYYQRIFKAEGISDPIRKAKRVEEEKGNIIRFLSGVENSGKAIFAGFYISPDGKEQREVRITAVDTKTEGGDWNTDIIEAVNMICFACRVHSNLVGSVPSKSSVNNSGSDKRELYTIAQALQKPYHDLIFGVHTAVIRFNGWKGVKPTVPFIQLTTLDERKDAKLVSLEGENTYEE